MRLTIFGATGRTGRELVEQALAAGHEVTAAVRNPGGLPLQHERLRVARADVFDPAAIAPLVEGRDAVVSALGARPSDDVTICSRATRSIAEAMRVVGVRRIVVVSASPVSPGGAGDRFLYRTFAKPVLKAILRKAYADMAVMEDQLARSGLDWTIVRPPRLTDKGRTGRYRTARDRNVPGGYTLSRSDLADAILRLLPDTSAVRAAIGIGY